MRVALYARVSTRDKRQDTANQINEMRILCLAQGWGIAAEYEDHESGSKAARPQFQQMLKDAALKKFDLLIF